MLLMTGVSPQTRRSLHRPIDAVFFPVSREFSRDQFDPDCALRQIPSSLSGFSLRFRQRSLLTAPRPGFQFDEPLALDLGFGLPVPELKPSHTPSFVLFELFNLFFD